MLMPLTLRLLTLIQLLLTFKNWMPKMLLTLKKWLPKMLLTMKNRWLKLTSWKPKMLLTMKKWWLKLTSGKPKMLLALTTWLLEWTTWTPKMLLKLLALTTKLCALEIILKVPNHKRLKLNLVSFILSWKNLVLDLQCLSRCLSRQRNRLCC